MTLTPPIALEALLFAHGESLTKKRIAELLDLTPQELVTVVSALREQLRGRGLSVVETNNELELRTAPDAAPIVKKLRESELSRDLGRAGLETLAFVLYKDGATRGEIDFVRGVNSTAALRSLLMRGLIERTDDPVDRRRARYLPTTEALAHLGVTNREALPNFTELEAALSTRAREVETPATM